MPRRPDWAQMKESILSIFGVYRGVDPNWHSPPRPEWSPTVDVDDAPVVRLGLARAAAAAPVHVEGG
jgi:hypothetical protein